MKEKVFNISKYIVSLIPLMAVLVTVITSLGWGVPNKTINDIVLPRNPESRAETIKLISEVSSKDINTRASLVIEGKSEDLKDNLRIARRYLLYSENPDEMMALAGLSGINPKALKFKPKCFNYGGGYIYPMGAMIAIGRILQGKNLNISLSSAINDPDNIASLYMWGRALNVFVILILFSGLYLIFNTQGFNNKLSLFVSGIIVSSPVIINWATIMKPHLTGAAFFILSAGTAMLGPQKGKLEKYFLLSMALAGYASSAQYFMITAGMIPCLILLENSKISVKKKFIMLPIGIAVAGIIFFIFNPYHLFNLESVFIDLKRGRDYYSPEWFNIKSPYFVLWMWCIGSGFISVPLLAGLFKKGKIIKFLKKYNYLLITVIIFGYYLSSLCISLGFHALTTRLFIPVILLISILLLLRINYFKNNIIKKTILSLLFVGCITNIYIMKTVLNQGLSPQRPYFEASRHLNQVYRKYDKVFSKHATPAPYITPACSIKCNIKPWSGKLKNNELLVSESKVKGLKLIKSFESKNRYLKMSFAEKDFYFYIKSDKK